MIMPFLVYLSQFGWVPALLLLSGLALVLVEFAIPGFGLPGISGIVLLAAGIIIKAETLLEGLLLLLVIIAVAGTAGFFLLRSASRGRLSRSRFVLQAATRREDGFSATDEAETSSFIGQCGEALTDLRPAGAALIGDKRLDVVSDSEYIPRGSKICISRVEGRRIVVARK